MSEAKKQFIQGEVIKAGEPDGPRNRYVVKRDDDTTFYISVYDKSYEVGDKIMGPGWLKLDDVKGKAHYRFGDPPPDDVKPDVITYVPTVGEPTKEIPDIKYATYFDYYKMCADAEIIALLEQLVGDKMVRSPDTIMFDLATKAACCVNP